MKLWNIIEYLKEEGFVQTKDKPWVSYSNKGLLRDLMEDSIEIPSKYLTKDDVRFKLAKNKLDQDKKLRKQQAEEAREN